MANHIITITIDSNGDFTHSPSALHAPAGDYVYWQCKYPFAIQFQVETPLDNYSGSAVSIPSVTGMTSTDVYLPYSTTPLAVDGEANGNFHYAVAVWNTDTSQVLIDAGCPVIICN
jgi:hypothetical protein